MKTTEKTETTNCARCNSLFPVHPPGYCGGTGVAIMPDGSRICYTCADADQVEELKKRKPLGAYVSSDGKRITTWTDGTLMHITQSWPCQLTRNSHWHDAKSYRCIRATDVHGNRWYGRGSAGVCIRMRPCK